MASTAALAATMRSFDESGRDGVGDRTGYLAAGTSRVGGVSFGTDEGSFHSDDYEREKDRPAPSLAGRAGQRSRGTVNGKARAVLGDVAEDDEEEDSRPRYTSGKRRVIPSAVIAVGGGGTPGQATGHEGESTMLRALDQGGSSSINDSSRFDAANSPPEKAVNGVKRNGVGSNAQARAAKGNQLTLREQEKVMDEIKKENFNLKLKIYFLEDRLAKLAPDQIDQALKENIEIKVEFQTVRQELKRYRRLLLEAEKAIESVKAERDDALNQATGANRKAGRGAEAELRRMREEAERERAARLKAEQLLAKAQNDLRAARDGRRRGSSLGSDAGEIRRLQEELEDERAARDELQGDNEDLRDQLASAQDALAETNEELQRLADLRSSSASRSSSRIDSDELGASSRGRLGRKVKELEEDNAALRSQVNAQVTMLATRNGEKEDLKEEVEGLRRTVMELEDELELKQRESDRLREHSRSGGDNDEEVKLLQGELNTCRDKLAAALLEAERREKEIEELVAELDEREAAFNEEVDKAAQEFKGDLEDARAQRSELQETLDERDEQVRELSEKLEDLIAMQEESGEKLEAMEKKLQEKEDEVALLAEELEATQADLKDIGAGTRDMAQELADKERQIAELNTELDELERDSNSRQTVHDEVVAKLKLKHTTAKSELSELTVQHESAQTELVFLREKLEDLALRQAEKEEQRRGDSEVNRRLEDQIADLERMLRDEKDDRDQDASRFRREKREQQAVWQQSIDAKQKALAHAESELASIKGRLGVRENDLDKLQNALRHLEKESDRLTESQSNDRVSLELEVERLQRDLAAMEDELEQAKADGDDARDELQRVHLDSEATRTEREDLADKLKKVQRARNEDAAKLEEQTKTLRKAQDELAQTKSRLQSVQDTATTNSRQLSKTEKSYKQKLDEAKVKVATAEGSWQARLRELESRNRQLEEKVKRERQGAKERVNELVSQISGLKEQVVAQQRRGKQLDEVLKEAKGKANSASA